MPRQGIKLGDEIEDVTSGLRGIALAEIKYLSGQKYWILQPPTNSSGEPQRDQYIPDAYVKRVGDGVRIDPKPSPGFHVRDGEH